MNSQHRAIQPLVVEFRVETDPARAFDTWVSRAALWWPVGHTRSGRLERVVFEPFVGGRVYEVDAAGGEHDWAEVRGWNPPHSLQLAWHHVFPRAEATDLLISFRPADEGTVVRIEQRGWEVLGAEEGAARRDRTTSGWVSVTTRYRDLLEKGA